MMDKVFGLIILLSVYQMAGMLKYHDFPVVKQHQIEAACISVGIC